MKRILRVRIYELDSGRNKWDATLDHVFYGKTRAEAKNKAEAHRQEDGFYRAALASSTYKGVKLQSRATWVY